MHASGRFVFRSFHLVGSTARNECFSLLKTCWNQEEWAAKKLQARFRGRHVRNTNTKITIPLYKRLLERISSWSDASQSALAIAFAVAFTAATVLTLLIVAFSLGLAWLWSATWQKRTAGGVLAIVFYTCVVSNFPLKAATTKKCEGEPGVHQDVTNGHWGVPFPLQVKSVVVEGIKA